MSDKATVIEETGIVTTTVFDGDDVSELREQPVALLELRTAFMQMPVPKMQVGLAEYEARRNCFRSWLESNMKEGVHYGYPPGCEPNLDPATGGMVVAAKGGGTKIVPRKQWVSKPSLYKPGAQLVCDLMSVRAEYTPDIETWKMQGEIKGTYAYLCELYSKETCMKLGEGRGSYRSNAQMDANAAIKMAEKSALIDACLSTWALSDLFTQDREDGPKPHEGPEQAADAPTAQPRGQRVTTEQLEGISRRWKEYHPESPRADFLKWAAATTGLSLEEVHLVAKWTQTDVGRCTDRMDQEQGSDGPPNFDTDDLPY